MRVVCVLKSVKQKTVIVACASFDWILSYEVGLSFPHSNSERLQIRHSLCQRVTELFKLSKILLITLKSSLSVPLNQHNV